VLNPIITSRRSDEEVDTFTSWQVGYAENVTRASGSCTVHQLNIIKMRVYSRTFALEPASIQMKLLATL
jgi:hypothetical protein